MGMQKKAKNILKKIINSNNAFKYKVVHKIVF